MPPERGPEIGRAAPLGAHARDQEDRLRHELPDPCEVSRLRRSDHRPHARQAVGAGEPVAAGGDDLGDALIERPAAGVQIQEVGRPGIRGPNEDEEARAGAHRDLGEGIENVASHQRVHRDGVRPERLRIARRLVRSANQALRVDRGDVRHVAPLGVGDDEEPRLLRRGDGLGERLPAAGPESLEAGELGLDRDAELPGLVDQAPAALGDVVGWTRIRVQPETDLASPLRDRSGEPIRKGFAQLSP